MSVIFILSEKSSLGVNRSFNRSASFSVSKLTETYCSYYSLCSLWVGLSDRTQTLTFVLVFKEEQTRGPKKNETSRSFEGSGSEYIRGTYSLLQLVLADRPLLH